MVQKKSPRRKFEETLVPFPNQKYLPQFIDFLQKNKAKVSNHQDKIIVSFFLSSKNKMPVNYPSMESFQRIDLQQMISIKFYQWLFRLGVVVKKWASGPTQAPDVIYFPKL
jgi:hypothetical protein